MALEAERKEQELGPGYQVKSELTFFGNGVGVDQLFPVFKATPWYSTCLKNMNEG